MKEFNGFSYICSNCNHYDFVWTSYDPTPDSTTRYTCLNCREKLPATSIILHLNILDLIKEGLVQPMAQKVRKWKKLEGQPQEVEIISDCWTQPCPFCKANGQKYISYSKTPYRVGLLCMYCSTVYYAEFVDAIECDISADKLAEVINKINSHINEDSDVLLVRDKFIEDLANVILESNSYFNKQEFKDACYKVVKEGEVNGTN